MLDIFLTPKIKTYLALSCCCINEKDVIAYFTHLVQTPFQHLLKKQKIRIPKGNTENIHKKEMISNLQKFRKKMPEKKEKFLKRKAIKELQNAYYVKRASAFYVIIVLKQTDGLVRALYKGARHVFQLAVLPYAIGFICLFLIPLA